MIRTVCLLLIIGVAIGCTKVSPPQNSVTGSTTQEQMPSSQFVATVLRVLEENHQSGSLVYRGSCTNYGGIADSFKVSSPVRDVPPVEALHQAFVNDAALTVKEDSSGMIRVVGGDVQPELLGVTIHDVKFQEENDPREATSKLLASPELAAYMQGHRTEFVETSGGLIPPPSGRHLSGTLTDMTVSQSLDRIAQTFPGVWVYEECVTGQGEKRVVIIFHEFSAATSSRTGGPELAVFSFPVPKLWVPRPCVFCKGGHRNCRYYEKLCRAVCIAP
jgi:hypothetical protein